MELGTVLMNVGTIIVLAIVAESVWETLKLLWDSPVIDETGKLNKKELTNRLGAIVIGLLVAFGANLDILALFGINVVIPYLGIVLTGILVSRGANYMHDLISKMKNSKDAHNEVVIVEVDKEDE